jgi:hypothetical protein
MTTEQKTEFAQNYDIHDILQYHLTDRLSMIGLDVEQFGFDGDRGSKNYDAGFGPDLKIYADGELCAYIEVKSKRLSANGDEWYGRLDKQHYDEYLYGNEHGFDGAKNEDVPVVIYFGVVDEESGVIVRDGFIEVESEEQVQDGFRLGGDIVVTLDKDDERNIHWLLYELGI